MYQASGTSSATRRPWPAEDDTEGAISADSRSYLTQADVVTAPLRAELSGQSLVLRSDIAFDRSGNPYIVLLLRDVNGARISARWWRYPYPPERRPTEGMICWFRASVDEFAGERQISITAGKPIPEADVAIYAQATHTPVTELQTQLEKEIGCLDASLQALVRMTMSGDVFSRYCEWPAAHFRHGALRHGLLAHSLRVAHIAKQLGEICVPQTITYDAHLVTAAAILHDIGKTQTLPRFAGSAMPEQAKHVDHVTLGVLMVRQAAMSAEPMLETHRLDMLTHAMLAHHGKREWGAPIEPATLEAWLVHLADLVEARLWRWSGEEASQENESR